MLIIKICKVEQMTALADDKVSQISFYNMKLLAFN